MILSFSKEKFVQRIKGGIKKHTIRIDTRKRWRAGRIIQFWFGNPRNVKKNPYEFGTGVATKIEDVFINPIENFISVKLYKDGNVYGHKMINDQEELDEFSRNDGFEDWADMKNVVCSTVFREVDLLGRL